MIVEKRVASWLGGPLATWGWLTLSLFPLINQLASANPFVLKTLQRLAYRRVRYPSNVASSQ